MTHYEVLGIDSTATHDEIKRTYRQLAKKYHPDVNDAGNSKQFFQLISDAYSVLSDPQKRAQYDTPPTESNYQAPHREDTPKEPETECQIPYVDDTFTQEELNLIFERQIKREERLPKALKIIGLILLFPIILALKLVGIVLIILLSFIEFLLKIAATFVILFSGIIIFVAIAMVIVLLLSYDSAAADAMPLWQILGYPGIILFIGFILPHVAVYAMVPFVFIKDLLKRFVFPRLARSV